MRKLIIIPILFLCLCSLLSVTSSPVYSQKGGMGGEMKNETVIITGTLSQGVYNNGTSSYDYDLAASVNVTGFNNTTYNVLLQVWVAQYSLWLDVDMKIVTTDNNGEASISQLFASTYDICCIQGALINPYLDPSNTNYGYWIRARLLNSSNGNVLYTDCNDGYFIEVDYR